MTEEIPLDVALRRQRRGNAARSDRKSSMALRFERAAEMALDQSAPYLLKGLIHRGDLSVWYGPSGCGKTFLTLHLAHAISTGRPVFGRRVRPARVLLFALEGSSGLSKRVAAVQKAYGAASDLIVCRGALPLFGNVGLADQIIDAINEHDVDLVIVDTLSRSMAGADENAPADMTRMVGIFDRIRHETGAHVLVVHHTGKDEERGGRGHSSLRAAVDVEVQVSRDRAGTRYCHITKGRDDADGQTFGFGLKVVSVGIDEDGDDISTCVLEEDVAPPQRTNLVKLNKGDQEALSWLQEAIVEFGEYPDANLPSGIGKVVTKDAWMVIARKRTVTNSDDALRKQITRATTNLTVAHKIAVHAPYIWVL